MIDTLDITEGLPEKQQIGLCPTYSVKGNIPCLGGD